jgi:nucleoside-diphosphate-sugar epimerase
VEVVLHLAALARTDATFDELLPANVVGTYNVLEAARLAGARRVVFASSGAVTNGYEQDAPYRELAGGEGLPAGGQWPMITHDSPVRPQGFYGCTKVWGEVLGRHYADCSGLSVLCVRIGAVVPEDRPTALRHRSVWCSQRDVAQMLERCIAAPSDLRYDIFYAVSNNRRNYRDLAHGRAVLGFVPQDGADDTSQAQ